LEHFRSETIPEEKTSSPGAHWKWFIKDIFQTLLLSALVFLGVNAITARIRVESVSMQDTLLAGDFVIVNKLAYLFDEPKRGDVVVFTPPFEASEPYIKRIIGLPGDEIVIHGGKVSVNGEIFQEPYVHSPLGTSGNWSVPQGTLFVMGDNRDNSSDSRAWGTVPIENVIGEAIFVYWPPDQWGALTRSAIAAEALK
jgi:signal peptidase I